ncbi:hypothetical protein ACGFYQ_36700 [Streptomyces sp. NPDC048258]|uniref:hypothetical protein n=1 Tax=Streptomyces sp. NPDC048258 TaxID=3365527 RepID=UPI003718DA06
MSDEQNHRPDARNHRPDAATDEGDGADGSPAAVPAPLRRTRRTTVAVLAGVLSVAVLAGGGFWASAAMDRADRTAPTLYWAAEDAPEPSGSEPPVPTVPPNDLVAKLLPYTTVLSPGPDIDVEGHDFYVPAERALQSLKDSETGLSDERRAERDKTLAELKLKGLAARSYLAGSHAAPAGVEIRLTQADPQALASLSALTGKLLELLQSLRDGDAREAPKVEGFDNAKCVLSTVRAPRREDKEDKEDKVLSTVENIECVAVQGDVLVDFKVYTGARQFSATDAVNLFKEQLNRLKSPGESV